MTLITPGIDYKAIRDAIISLLRHNVATLNTNLTTPIMAITEQIKAGEPLIYPDIFFNVNPSIVLKFAGRTDEDFAGLGGGGRKKATVTFTLYAGAQLLKEHPDDEIMQFLKNIESVFRDNISIDDNVLWTIIKPANVGIGQYGDTYFDIIEMNLDCIVEVK